MTREQCDLLSAPLVRTVNDMEDEILRVIAAQLAKDGNISDTSKWRIRQLARSGEMDKETARIIARYSGLEEGFAMAAIEDAAKIEMGYVDNAVRAEGLAALTMGGEASAEASAMGAYTAFQRQAKSSLNLVNTVMMYKAKQTFVNGVNKIYYESEKSRQDALNTMGKYSAGTVMGQFSLQEATRRCIREMTAKGIPAFVDKRGREWSPEAYVMMDMRSTLGNTARAAQWARCDEYGIKLIEVSSHLGARPGCAPYQGRIFSRDGSSGTTTDGAGNKITYTPLSQTSYGKPDGLFGINCGHVQYPFFPGCSFQSYFPYPKEENAEMYKNHQKQRYYERQIRAAKRECVMLNETGDTEGFKAAAARLKRSKESYRKFTESKGLYLHNDRTQVVGFDRSVSGKATWANRKAEQAKASAAAVKVGGVPTGGKGSSGGHAVTVTPPRDPVVGNSANVYRDGDFGLTENKNGGIINNKAINLEERKTLKQHDIDDCYNTTNPKYGTDIAYSRNCQRCVVAYEARRRGYDVVAKPWAGEGDRLPSNWANVFEGGEEGIISFEDCKTRGQAHLGVKSKMEEYGNGARAIVRVRSAKKSHVIIAEQVNNRTIFIDPQTGKRDASGYFRYTGVYPICPEKTVLLRIDDKQFTEMIGECVE